MNDLDLYRDKFECSMASPARHRRDEKPEAPRDATKPLPGLLALATLAMSRWNPFPRI